MTREERERNAFFCLRAQALLAAERLAAAHGKRRDREAAVDDLVDKPLELFYIVVVIVYMWMCFIVGLSTIKHIHVCFIVVCQQ